MNQEKKIEQLTKKYAGSGNVPSDKKNLSFRPGGGPPGAKGMMASGKPKNIMPSIKRLFSYIRADVPMMCLALFCVAVNSLSALAGSYMLRPIINTFIAPKDGKGDLKGLAAALLVMLVVYIIGTLATYAQSRIMIGISQKALQSIRNDLFQKIQKLPVRFYDTNSNGELMSRFTNDVDAIGEMMNNTVIQMVSGVISLVGSLILMLYTNVWLTIITIVLIPVLAKAGSVIAKTSRKYYTGQQAALGAVNGYIEETISGQKVVKVFNHEEKAKAEFELLNQSLRDKQINAQFVGGIMGPVMGNLGQMNYVITACVGGVLCVLKNFDVGGLTVFVNFSRQFSRPINEVSMQMNTIFSALAGAERVFEIMDQEPEPADEEGAVSADGIEGDVVLKNVTFGYNTEKTILKNISLHAGKGQKIAFVGSTGAGKTTITNLLTRFYDIWDGEILIDGKNMNAYERKSLRQNIAMVLQDTHLFTGTVMENIRYGRLDATDEEVIEAAKVASAHSFIKRLEHGYDTVLEGDGANLSQGQRQLLNIARAAISKAPILVLDEATSSVDTRTERHIEHGMQRLMKERTTFIIAHRLSTVRNADCIYVLEQGEIVESGNHEQLLAQKGRYYKLYTGALELD